MTNKAENTLYQTEKNILGRLAESAIFWIFLGVLMWYMELVKLLAELGESPEFISRYTVFGAWKSIVEVTPVKDVVVNLLFYIVIFLIAGLLFELTRRMSLRKMESLIDSVQWHVGTSLFFAIMFISTATLQSEIITTAARLKDLVWELALVAIAVGAFIAAVRMEEGKKWFSSRALWPAGFAALWLLPVLYVAQHKFSIVSSPLSYVIFVLVGATISMAPYVLKLKPEKGRSSSTVINVLKGLALIFLLLSGGWFYTIALYPPMMTIKIKDSGGPRPNIIMIVMDTVRGDHLSCYGYERPTTPAIDRFAEEGVLFENAMASEFWTIPNHASIFTGQFPGEHMATGLNPFLDLSYPTLAQVLFGIGYETVSIAANPNLNLTNGLTRGFEHYEVLGMDKKYLLGKSKIGIYFDMILARVYPGYWSKSDDGGEKAYENAATVLKKAKGWLTSRKNGDKPYFLFINLMDAHLPYFPPEQPDLDRFIPDRKKYEKALGIDFRALQVVSGRVNPTAEDFESLAALYDAQIRYEDDNIGAFLDFMEKRHKADNTIVIITSDHGEFLGEHNITDHSLRASYPTLNIPLIIKGLPVYSPGARVTSLVQNIDILPTIMEILKIKINSREKMPGISLLHTNNDRRGYADAYPLKKMLESLKKYAPEKAEYYHKQSSVIWDNGYEYIWSSDGEREYYYLPEDPREENNLVGSSSELENELDGKAEKRAKRSPGKPLNEMEVDLSPEEKNRLRALGYLK